MERLKFSTVWYKRNVEGQKEEVGMFSTQAHTFQLIHIWEENIDENRFVR